MSQFNYTKKPGWLPAANITADSRGWVFTPTGEVIVACRGLDAKNSDAVTVVGWTLVLPTNKTYTTDEEIVLTLVPDEAVFVVGTPYIEVGIGSQTKQFAFDADNSTPTSLKFSYTVELGDSDSDGITVSNTLTKGTAKLYDVVGDGQVEITGPITYTVGSTAGILVSGV